jgi:DNA-binding transcriptional MerR regulator
MKQGNINKSAKNFYTIKEVSELTSIPVHTLRFWEKVFKGYITPVRTNGGHRRYTIETIDLIKHVRIFVYDKGYTLNGALNELKLHDSIGIELKKQNNIETLVNEIAKMIKERILRDVRQEL